MLGTINRNPQTGLYEAELLLEQHPEPEPKKVRHQYATMEGVREWVDRVTSSAAVAPSSSVWDTEREQFKARKLRPSKAAPAPEPAPDPEPAKKTTKAKKAPAKKAAAEKAPAVAPTSAATKAATKKAEKPATSGAVPSEKRAAIRAWAAEQGIAVKERGRIPADVVQKYDEDMKRRPPAAVFSAPS